MAYLKLLRAGTLFSPAADVIAGLCLAQLDWSTDAVRAILASVALYAAGMVLNDHADRREDAVMRPERPIPRGDITAGTALALGAALIAASLLLAPWWPYYAVMAALVIGYDYAFKRSVAGGAITMGTLRGLNLCAGAVVLTQAVPPRELLIAAGAYALYIIAVTLLGILEDRAPVKRRVAVSIQNVPPLCAALALLGMPHPWPAAAIAFALAAVFLLRMRTVTEWDQKAIRGSMTWLLLGTMLYTGLLCLAANRPLEAFAVWLAVLPAKWISRRIALT